MLRSPIVSLNRNPPSSGGPLNVPEPHRTTATATSSPAIIASSYIERLRWLVIPEEQIPGFLVLIHSSRLQRRRDVEHHDVLLMMGKNTGKIMPADCARPCVDNRFDLTFGRSALLHHGFSFRLFAVVCP